MRHHRQRVWMLVLALTALAALAAVFTLYGQSDFMVQIANQMWSCL